MSKHSKIIDDLQHLKMPCLLKKYITKKTHSQVEITFLISKNNSIDKELNIILPFLYRNYFIFTNLLFQKLTLKIKSKDNIIKQYNLPIESLIFYLTEPDYFQNLIKYFELRYKSSEVLMVSLVLEVK